MSVKFAINGFGRIGKSILRAYLMGNNSNLECVVINAGSGSIEDNMHFFKFDSTHGVFDDVEATNIGIKTSKHKEIPVIATYDIGEIDWTKYGVDVVLDCTGAFVSKDKASSHLRSGAKKVIVSAPCEGADATIVHKVNDSALKPEHQVISIGSCTTNCLAPIVKVLNDNIGIECGFMTTIHAYTSDQRLLDADHKDKRRARAAALSMIPSSTGAAKALGLVLPELAGKLDGVAIRVPTPNVSLVDLKFNAKREVDIKEVNAFVEAAAKSSMQGVLYYDERELVSIDYNGNSHSSVFDATQTKVVSGKFVRVAAWYDNEWGFSNRMLDVTRLFGGMI